MLFHCLLACIISNKKSFKNFSFYIVYEQFHYTISWCGFLQLQNSWICVLIVFLFIWKNFKHYFFKPSSIPPLETSYYVCIRPLDMISHLTDALFVAFVLSQFFPPCFTSDSVSCCVFKFTNLSFCNMSSFDWFFSSLWLNFLGFCMLCNFWLNARHGEFYLFGCWIFFQHSFKYSWSFFLGCYWVTLRQFDLFRSWFWDLLGGTRAVFSLVLIIPLLNILPNAR